MRDVTFTFYRNAQDTAGEPTIRPWGRWLELFSRHEVRGAPGDTEDRTALDRAKNGPAIVLGEIPRGKPRRGAHVRAVHALALDIENQVEGKVEEVVRKLGGFEFVVWTTHKHGSVVAKEYPRLRLLLPLATPINPSDHGSAWSGLNQLADGVNDPATRDVGRLHFLPSTFDERLAWAFHHPGRWLQLEDLPDAEASTSVEAFDGVAQQQALNRVRHQLRCVQSTDEVKEPARRLLEGDPFADEGTRHNTILALTMWIALRDRNLNAQSIRQLFGPSVDAMQEAAPNAPGMEEVVRAYEGAVERLGVLDKQQDEDQKRKAREVQLANAAEGQGPYTEEDLVRIARTNDWQSEDLKDRWIIQRDGAAWFLTEQGEYAGPYSRDDVSLAASKYLARAPVRLVEATRGGYRYRPIVEVIREAGSLVDKVISDMTIQRTCYDPLHRVMHEAILVVRREELEPEFNSEFDGWLKVTGGPLYSKLVDWIACCSDLTKLLCAIYFDGAPSSGKTLFAHGIAKIWTDGPPADIDAVLSDFNDEIARCPLVIADEEIPRRWRSTVTTTLRSMLSTVSRTLKRKYKPTSEVRGAVRLILTANNEFLLDSRDVASSQDLEAIAQRFLYVPVPQEAATLLNNLSRKTKEYWMNEGIAKHALWLAEHHEVKEPGKRFWVEGDVSQMHRLLMTGSRWNSLCCEWLVRYAMNPQPYNTQATGFIRTGEGELLVNDQALIDGWDLYLKTKMEPETAKIGAALRAISKTTRRRQLRWHGKQIRYRPIDVDHLISWADRYNVGDQESILETIGERPLRQPGEDEDDNVVVLKQPGAAWEERGIDKEKPEDGSGSEPVPF